MAFHVLPLQPRLERSARNSSRSSSLTSCGADVRLHGPLFVERARAARAANPSDDVRLIGVRVERQLDEVVTALIE